VNRRWPLIFLCIVLAALLPVVFQIAEPFFAPMVIAVVLAIVMTPVRKWLGRKVGRPGVAALLTTLVVLLMVVVPFGLVGVALTEELTTAYDQLSRLSDAQGGWQALVNNSIDRGLDAAATYLPINQAELKAELVERIKSVAGSGLKLVGRAFGGATATLLNLVLVMILLYFVLRYGDEWLRNLYTLLPLDSRVTSSLLQTVQDAIIANVDGVLVVAVSQGALLGIAFAVAGIHAPVMWGIIGGLASMIPIVGIVLVWLPFVIGHAILGAYAKAALLALWCVLVVGSVDNVIRPLVVRGRVKQHPALIAASIIGGTTAFGPIGLLVGPVVTSFVLALIAEIRRQLWPELISPDITEPGS